MQLLKRTRLYHFDRNYRKAANCNLFSQPIKNESLIDEFTDTDIIIQTFAKKKKCKIS